MSIKIQTRLSPDSRDFRFFTLVDPNTTEPNLLPKPSLSKHEKMTGNSEIDETIRTLLDYIFRDCIKSWQLTNNKDFTNETRIIVEKIVYRLTKRIKRAPLLSVVTTKMIDDVAAHTKTYNRALRTLKDQSKKAPAPSKFSSPFHRRNKSDTDVNNSRKWSLGSALIHKKVANSTFYSVQTDEKLLDPERQLIEQFFDNFENLFKDESLDDEALEKHLIAMLETIIYFTLEPEDFNCDAARSFLAPLLSSVVGKSVVLPTENLVGP